MKRHAFLVGAFVLLAGVFALVFGLLLALLARDPAGIANVLLPWQAQLFSSDPSWQS